MNRHVSIHPPGDMAVARASRPLQKADDRFGGAGQWMAPPGFTAMTCMLALGGMRMTAETTGTEDPPSPYHSWEAANGITGAGPAVDSDGDGIPNGIEFVIGGDPSGPASDSNSLLPVITLDADHLYFIFRRTDAASGYDPFVEYSSSLGQWTLAEPGVDGISIEESLDFHGPGVARVTVKLPRSLASGTKLFARLGVEIAD
jgi:hypothetical protein